jgi:hypothetical protein
MRAEVRLLQLPFDVPIIERMYLDPGYSGRTNDVRHGCLLDN